MLKLRFLSLSSGSVLGSAAFAADYVATFSTGAKKFRPGHQAREMPRSRLPDGSQIEYRLIVANIDNVVASHIHLGAAGTNGGVVAFLFGAVAPGGGPSNGVLATGTITAANLVGDLAGQPLSALLDAMQAGNTYVNVHTNDGIDPTNTGPGDFPGGEIRAQIRPAD
jgi:hypothetical protein